ncbi:hypothetical protein EYD45_06745 [Hyunsoonleella flava]|uniref:Cytochrome c domain-containing protein n=1 Tax=Hyunsoonleella flava TaxID=2527939 RepID=A0A4Q9FFA9_9FLAO|nr:hypothetical protein [Hyunsoonleella flava]TBN04311.1 hypothetical protein EYD45_06745 [Hyunsoonleella flava]
MKLKPIIFVILLITLSCNTNKRQKEISELTPLTKIESIDKVSANIVGDSIGYKLMVQKCYICHFEKPDPSKRNQMIAPPMLRVQEHYKLSFTNKQEFVDAVVNFVKTPSEEKTLMPGAVKKFKLMPKLIYKDADLRLIAETIYDYDFGSAPKARKRMLGTNKIQLNNGKKWKLSPKSVELMQEAIKKVNNFKSDNISDYNQLGKEVFNKAKQIMLDDAHTGEKFDQIHLFFYRIEDNMHLLMAIKSIDTAKFQFSELKRKLNEFDTYFE